MEEEPPPEFVCPITQTVMQHPYMDREGHSFEYTAILQWLIGNDKCPVGREALLCETLSPNRALRSLIERSGLLEGEKESEEDLLAQELKLKLQVEDSEKVRKNPPPPPPPHGAPPPSAYRGPKAPTTASTSSPAPSISPAELRGRKCKALYRFTASRDFEMSLEEGEEITIHSVDAQWWIGSTGTKYGSFPSNYVSLLPLSSHPPSLPRSQSSLSSSSSISPSPSVSPSPSPRSTPTSSSSLPRSRSFPEPPPSPLPSSSMTSPRPEHDYTVPPPRDSPRLPPSHPSIPTVPTSPRITPTPPPGPPPPNARRTPLSPRMAHKVPPPPSRGPPLPPRSQDVPMTHSPPSHVPTVAPPPGPRPPTVKRFPLPDSNHPKQ